MKAIRCKAIVWCYLFMCEFSSENTIFFNVLFHSLMWPTLDDSPKVKTLVGGWALELINSHHVPTIASKTR